MPDISSIGHGSVGPIDRAAGRLTNGLAGAAETRATESRLEDRVELSDHARFLTRLRQLPEVRRDLIDEVRAAIEQDEYETPERLDAAIDRLLLEL